MPVELTSDDVSNTDNDSTDVEEVAEPATRLEADSATQANADKESTQTVEAFENTAEAARSALPPLTTLETDSVEEVKTDESNLQATVEQATESPADAPDDDPDDGLASSKEEQAQLDEIMQRLGIAPSEKTEAAVEDAPESGKPAAREPASTIPTESLDSTEPTTQRRQYAPTLEFSDTETPEDQLVSPETTAEVENAQPSVRERASTIPTESLDSTESTPKRRQFAPTIEVGEPVSETPENQLLSSEQTAEAESTEETEEEVSNAVESTLETSMLQSSLDTDEPESNPQATATSIEETLPQEEVNNELKTEEVTEQPASDAKPKGEQSSVADILARMKSEGKLDQFEEPDADNNSVATENPQPEVAPEPEPVQPGPEAADAADAADASDASEGDESVQDYMNQLFNRLRGDEAEPATAAPEPTVEKTEAVEEPKQESTPSPTPATSTTPATSATPTTSEPKNSVLEASEYIPKQRAPEAKTDIQALRQLANKQKTNAVSKSFKAKSKLEQAIASYVAGGAFAGSIAFGWIAKSLFDPAGILAVLCFVASMVALSRYVSNLKKMKAIAKQGAESN